MKRATVNTIKTVVEAYVPKDSSITFDYEVDNVYKSIDIYYKQHDKLHSTWRKDVITTNYPQDVVDLYDDIFSNVSFYSGDDNVLKTYDDYSFPIQGTTSPHIKYYFNQYSSILHAINNLDIYHTLNN